MTDDTQLEVPVPAPVQASSPRCAWCGEPSVGEFEIEPARKGKSANGVEVVKKRAITAPMCARHRDNLLADRREKRAKRVKEQAGWQPPKII